MKNNFQITLQSWFRVNTQKLARKYRKFINTYVKDRSFRRIERFVLSWLTIFGFAVAILFSQMGDLQGYYLSDGPADGGRYTEGIVGEIGVINPIFPETDPGRSAAAVIFDGLFSYDESGRIVPALAQSYVIDDSGMVYTIKLRQNLRWQDGKVLTANDVEFTFNSIQNPDVGSPLAINWRDIQIEAQTDDTVVFTLPNPYAPFLLQLTTGILPEHLLGTIEPSRLRVAAFNQNPIGSGPFIFEEISLDQTQLSLRQNPNYYRGKPRLDQLSLRVYPDQSELITAYNRGEVTGMLLDSTFDARELQSREASRVELAPLASQVFAFYNTKNITDKRLRQALNRSINLQALRSSIGKDYLKADSPLLPEHIGYQAAQPGYNKVAAMKLFKQAGYVLNSDGNLAKNNQALRLRLVTQDNHEYPNSAALLKTQWESLGVIVEIVAVPSLELQQTYIRPRNYDVLLFGIGLDADPDTYAYWHSSQIKDPGRNLSVYSSKTADAALEAGRTRTDSQLRAAKYQTFEETWQTDAPALALYRLHNYYVYREQSSGINVAKIAHPSDRFYNVAEWTVETKPVLQRLQPPVRQ